ncbi:unnamed protein product [marine sediment metagenome]|uniref:H-type lectin domain-containing protein n=1 Tax=marine sediment metagenome TaxID=412755 RepID=X1TDX2_9ZZZZ
MPERKVTISATAPSNPNTGDGWIHATTRVEKTWDGTAWEVVSATKSGQATGAKGAIVQVDFAIAFSSIPRVALATHSDVGVWLTEVAAGYFKWTNNSKGADVIIDWIATNAGNS